MSRGVELWHGNEACAFGALAAGVKFFGGYPITPSSEIAEILAYELPKVGGKFIQMEDEIAAMGSVLGASLAGMKVLTATSGPGLSLKQENVGFACMAEIPCVIINVMRGGPSTGLPTKASQSDVMQARWGTHGDKPTICLLPASIAECFHMTVQAFNYAERFRMPVYVMYDEVIGHMRERFAPPDPSELELVERKRPTETDPKKYLPYAHTADDVPPMGDFGDRWRYHVTGLFHDETGFPTNDTAEIHKKQQRLVRKLERCRGEVEAWEERDLDGADYVIVAYGSTARSAADAAAMLRADGHKVGTLRLKTAWPFPEARVREVAAGCKAMVVAEMNLGQMVYEVERCAGGRCPVRFFGKMDGELLTPDEIRAALVEVMA